MDRYAKSLALYASSRGRLPCGGQTLSKAPERMGLGSYPIYLSGGKGCRLTDIDGNAYIDYVCGLGPVILGYNHPTVNAAIRAQLETGIVTASLESPLVVEVAERICAMVPSAEAVRFVKTGSDACSAAVRLARAYTDRDIILTSGYHGWDDTFQVHAGDRTEGIPAQMLTTSHPFEYGDIRILEGAFAIYGPRVAAVILEPARTFTPRPGYLHAVKDLCHKHGALLVFDEVVTAFRWARGGAQEFYEVMPDITCLGKALANGMPLGAVCGPKNIMNTFERCFVSGTYGGEALSLAAAKATLNIIDREPVIPHIWAMGRTLRYKFNAAMAGEAIKAKSVGVDVCSVQTFDYGEQTNTVKTLWLQETARRGLLLGNIQYTNFSHADADMDMTGEAMRRAAQVIGNAIKAGTVACKLEGVPIGVDTYRPTPK